MNATRKEQKQKEAQERNEKWAALSYEEQLNQINTLFGVDRGATKQRAKIAKLMAIRDEQKPQKPQKPQKTIKKAKKEKK